MRGNEDLVMLCGQLFQNIFINFQVFAFNHHTYCPLKCVHISDLCPCLQQMPFFIAPSSVFPFIHLSIFTNQRHLKCAFNNRK